VENLPYTLAGPLHILPWWLTPVFWALLFMLFALLLWKYLGRVKELMSRLYKKEPLPGRKGKNAWRVIPVIKEIEEENLGRKTYRKGLFELSEVMKSHMERVFGLQVEEMTSGEISRFIRIREPGRFFREMDLLVFREQDPGKKEFTRMFGRAKKLAKIRIKRGDAHGDL
jgi:hypothetical protein